MKSAVVPPLQPPPQLSFEPHLLQKLIHVAIKRPFDEQIDSNAEARSRQGIVYCSYFLSCLTVYLTDALNIVPKV